MMRKLMAITLLLVVLVVGVSGCVIEDKVSNEEEASEAVVEVSETLDEISGTLEEVDDSLG